MKTIFKKIGRGCYKATTERYTLRIDKQDISKEWILSIQDHENKNCLTDTIYAAYNKKIYCVDHANNFINN